MRILYPCSPLDPTSPDPAFGDEYAAMQGSGVAVSVFSYDDLRFGEFRPRPRIEPGKPVLYRGWMLDVTSYGEFVGHISREGGVPHTSAEAYEHCHYLIGWYETCAHLTPETRFLERDSDYLEQLLRLDWDAYFIKDFVKSNSDELGSIASTPEQAVEIIRRIAHYRGAVEGGVAVRKVEELQPSSEQRYFVANGTPFSPTPHVPPIVEEVASLIQAPFYSIDVAVNQEGEDRVVELGDGQVSDRKHWSLERFVDMLTDLAG